MPEIEKLTLNDPETQSADIVAGNVVALQALFPEAFSEGRIDFDVLKQVLGGAVDEREEKYGLNWHGKRRARQIALTPSTGTLLPCPQDSVDWDTTQNLMIEGDNLEVLKLLQKSYSGKVKLIYIDPPYNTGKDFVYPDDFRDSIANYLEITGQVSGSRKISSNTESSGRFHTDWLNMMFPRLKLARQLISEDGLILVSIDENELPNLLLMANEIFGEEYFVECLVYDKKAAPKGVPPVNMIVGVHEYIVCFAKSEKSKFRGTLRSEEGFSNPDSDPRGKWRNTNLKSTIKDSSDTFVIRDPETGIEYEDTWAFSQAETVKMIEEKRLIFPKSSDGQVRQKEYFEEFGSAYIPVKSSLGLYDAQKNTQMIVGLMGGKIFQNPKHIDLMQKIIEISTTDESIVLDFFAGSGTTGHAVMCQNSADGKKRRYILVQLPEPLDSDITEQKTAASFLTKQKRPLNIAELTKERLRRAGSKVKVENPLLSGDTGFRVYKLASSNIRAWEPVAADLENTLLAHAEHLVQGRTEADVLTELLLKLGLDLCVPIEQKEIAGKAVHSIGAGALIACLSDGITRDVAEELGTGIAAWRKTLNPAVDTRVVFKDSGFADNDAKLNMAAILTQAGITDMRSL